ncbi:MAG: hypothetical protein L6R19_06160 [Alphaproteobacteria bacterium]|nr:hypothetical protein [Alphaproteobacteria bacterium]
MREAVATGDRNLLILPRGFAESGEEGKRREAQLCALAAEADLTVAGPNCAGIIHLTQRAAGKPLGMAATFLRDLQPGPDASVRSIALLSQSGALAEEIIAKALPAIASALPRFVSAAAKPGARASAARYSAIAPPMSPADFSALAGL